MLSVVLIYTWKYRFNLNFKDATENLLTELSSHNLRLFNSRECQDVWVTADEEQFLIF